MEWVKTNYPDLSTDKTYKPVGYTLEELIVRAGIK